MAQIDEQKLKSSTLYCAHALLKTAAEFLDHATDGMPKMYGFKQRTNNLIKQIRTYTTERHDVMDLAAYKIWIREFSQREYQSFAYVLTEMADMTDEQRLIVEQFVTQVKLGNVKMELEK